VFDHAHLLLNGSIVSNSSVKGFGGALRLEGRANVTITGRSRVQENNATEDGGGLVARGRAMLRVDGNSTLRGNSAGQFGGGLAALGNVSITFTGGSSVQGNIARNRSGGGLALWDSVECVLMDGSLVHSNRAARSGGGVIAYNNTVVTVLNCSVNYNKADNGGGIRVRDTAVLVLDSNSSVRNNSVVDSGGGLIVYDNAVVIITGGSRVEHNVARNGYGGGLFVGGSVHGNTVRNGLAGGLNVMGNSTVTLAGGSSVHNNTAVGGAGLYVDGNPTVTFTGASSVHNNTAVGGAGLYVDGNATVTFTGASSVHDNIATFFGGGLHVAGGPVVLTANSSVHSNTAKVGGGVAVSDEGMLTLTGGSSVHSNMALNNSGGGVHVFLGGRVTISNQSTVFNNTSFGTFGGGGGIAVEYGDVEVDSRGRVVSENVAATNDSDSDVEYQAKKDTCMARDRCSRVTISNSTVYNNTSIGAPGGGLGVGGMGTIELVDGTAVSHNTAVNSSGGGVVLLENGTLHADSTAAFLDNSVSKGYVGGTIAAFDNTTLQLRGGRLTKCSVGVYLGWSSCQAGETQQHDMCVCCPQHTFSFSNVTCEPCPRNGRCTAGITVQPLPGYWSSAPTSVQMHRCPLSTTACNYTGPDHQCNEGYAGPLCGACQLPHYGMLGPFECGKCLGHRVQLGLYMSMSGVSACLVTYTVHATWQDNLTGDKVVLATDMIKVLVQFLQYTAIIGSVSVPWPLFDLKRWFQAVNIVFAGATGQAPSLDCWLFSYVRQGSLPLAMQRQLVYFLAPVFALLAVVSLLWLFWALGRWVAPLLWQPKEDARQQPATSIVRKLSVASLVVTFYAYPTLLRASLSFFACLCIDRVPPEVQLPPGATARLNHTAGYLVSDISQECFAGYHKGWALGLGLPSIILWCVVVPVAMGVGLFLCRAKADEDSFREHFGFLYRSYRPERMWWEAVWAARTVVLTLISVFAIPMARYYDVLSLLVVFLVSGVLQNVFKPYAFATLHHMHKLSTSCLAATTLGAPAMLAYDIQESTAKNLRIAVAVLVMLVNVAFVGWCLWKLVPAVKGWCVAAYNMVKPWVWRAVNAALVRTGRPPLKAGQGRGRGRRGSAGCCV
jgi:hypothetical protein